MDMKKAIIPERLSFVIVEHVEILTLFKLLNKKYYSDLRHFSCGIELNSARAHLERWTFCFKIEAAIMQVYMLKLSYLVIFLMLVIVPRR